MQDKIKSLKDVFVVKPNVFHAPFSRAQNKEATRDSDASYSDERNYTTTFSQASYVK